MRVSLSAIVALLGATTVLSHAVMTIPTPRKTGPKQKALCGEALTTALEKDKAGPIEDAFAKKGSDYTTACNPYKCRGYQYEDNTGNVKALKAGDLVIFHIDLIAGHHPGYANTSIIDTTANKIIGSPLRSWNDWPNSTATTPRSDIDFNVTIPSTLGTTCSSAGKCVIQFYWYASGNKQTYESCIDFTV